MAKKKDVPAGPASAPPWRRDELQPFAEDTNSSADINANDPIK
ncbi:hypothetical protein [Azospirillum argentinense]